MRFLLHTVHQGGETDYPHSCFVKACHEFRETRDKMKSWELSVSVKAPLEMDGRIKAADHDCVLDRQFNTRQSIWYTTFDESRNFEGMT